MADKNKNALHSKIPKERIAAAVALAEGEEVDDEILSALADGVVAASIKARGALSKLPPEQSVPAVIRKFADADAGGREKLLGFVVAIGKTSDFAIEALIKDMATQENWDFRHRISDAVAGFKRRAVGPLQTALSRGTPQEIVALLDTFRRLKAQAKPALPALLPLLQHTDSDVAFNAANAICAINPKEKAVIPLMLQALSSNDERRCYVALDTIAWMGPPGATYVPQMIELLSAPKVRWRVIKSFATMGSLAVPAIPHLVPLLDDPEESDSTVETLARLNHPDAVVHVIDGLDNPKLLDNVLSNIRYIRDLAGPAIPKLCGLLSGPNRLKVIRALGELGKAAATAEPDLLPLLTDHDAAIRCAVKETLGQIK